MQLELRGKENYFDHEENIGIIARGENVEACFTEAARVMFSLMTDLKAVHLVQIITFEFEEADLELALITWLNLLLTKANEHHLVLSDFRIKHDGSRWKATVSGEKWREGIERGTEVKSATSELLSVKKLDHLWEARCIVDVKESNRE